MLARLPIGQCVLTQSTGARPAPVLARPVASPRVSFCTTSGHQLHSGQARCLVVAQGQANSSLRLPLELDLEQPLPGFDSIASALADLAAGKLIVVIDDEDRENEGDLIMNADKVTTETMAFLVEHTSGVVCISMEGRDLDRLRLPLMVSSAENEESMYTAFTITVDLRDGISTGISASDRTKTIRRLADPAAGPGDFRRPGHIFPLRYRPGGVLVRPGHTEAALDLARLSGSFPAGVLCEVVNKADGSMARTPQLLEFARVHGLRCITIADLIRYRLRHDALVVPAGEPTPVRSRAGGQLTAHCFRSTLDGVEHMAFMHGAVVDSTGEVLVHVHHERTVADLLDCSEPGTSSGGASSLDSALRAVAAAGAGVVLYIRGEAAHSVAPSEELAALSASGGGAGPAPATDLRDAALAAQMLRSLGVRNVALGGGDAHMATALRSCGLGVRIVPAAASPAPMAHNGNGSGHALAQGQQPLQAAGRR